MSTCPHCKQQINELEFEPLDATERGLLRPSQPLSVVAYLCPKCRVVLGVGGNPRRHGDVGEQ